MGYNQAGARSSGSQRISVSFNFTSLCVCVSEFYVCLSECYTFANVRVNAVYECVVCVCFVCEWMSVLGVCS